MDEMRQTPRERWWASGGCRGEEYEAAMDAREAAGQYLHGEADFMQRLGARSILDAGCGTGRIARELVRRGFEVVGVDIDAEMLAVARRKAPGSNSSAVGGGAWRGSSGASPPRCAPGAVAPSSACVASVSTPG